MLGRDDSRDAPCWHRLNDGLRERKLERHRVLVYGHDGVLWNCSELHVLVQLQRAGRRVPWLVYLDGRRLGRHPLQRRRAVRRPPRRRELWRLAPLADGHSVLCRRRRPRDALADADDEPDAEPDLDHLAFCYKDLDGLVEPDAERESDRK